MKTCRRCGVSKSLDEFTKAYNKKYNKYYPASNCKACKAEWQKEYRKNSPDKYKKANNRTVLKKHGFTPESFAEVLEAQGGVCKICKRPPRSGRLHIDHDHKCCDKNACNKCFRGLLCYSCNGALGLAEDNIETLRAMIEYLNGIEDKEVVAS
jgi:hypothetical protein